MDISTARTEPALASVIDSLTAGPRFMVTDAATAVPNLPGLYAFYVDEVGGEALGLVAGLPIYVGKAERSLQGRDVGTHFSTGKTGSSTLRRSLAALLREQLELSAVPRNLAKPDGSANFGLEVGGDERLSKWMSNHISLAVWVARDGAVLDDLETAVLRELAPPLNLSKMGAAGSRRVKAARAAMASEARAWSPTEA